MISPLRRLLTARQHDELARRAEALRALSALLRAGHPPRRALELWHGEAPEPLREGLRGVGRRVVLGERTPEALRSARQALGSDTASLQVLFALSGQLGGDLARLVDDLAEAVERRRDALETTVAAVAGMTLSARIVAGLPLVCLLLLPSSRAPLTDGPGALLVGLGVALTGTGMWWMNRLSPAPPQFEDGVGVIALAMSRALAGGAALHLSLEAACEHAPTDVRSDLRRARRLVRLGLTWPGALRRCANPDLSALSAVLERAERKGLPVAWALADFVARRDEARMRALDRAARRAPILMAVPLVACVLPAFMLLGIVPFLRGLGA